MFRQRTGSSLCYRCGKLNRVDASVCFYCGARRPGLWGFAPLAGRLVGRLDFAGAVITVCVALYVASILLDPAAAFRARSPFDMLSPSDRALVRLGMAGAAPPGVRPWGAPPPPPSLPPPPPPPTSQTPRGGPLAPPRAQPLRRARLPLASPP